MQKSLLIRPVVLGDDYRGAQDVSVTQFIGALNDARGVLLHPPAQLIGVDPIIQSNLNDRHVTRFGQGNQSGFEYLGVCTPNTLRAV